MDYSSRVAWSGSAALAGDPAPGISFVRGHYLLYIYSRPIWSAYFYTLHLMHSTNVLGVQFNSVNAIKSVTNKIF